MRITVVLPAYNEAQDLPTLLERLCSFFERSDFDYRIVVIDDGSSDHTAQIAWGFSLAHPVEILQHKSNQGLGAALRTGFSVISERDDEAVVVMDADNSHDPALITSMIEKLESGFDVVIGSRFQVGGQMIGVPTGRLILSRTASRVLRTVFRLPSVRDYSSGFRAYRASSLSKLKARYGEGFLTEDGFASMFELIVKLGRCGAKITEVPLILRYDLKRGTSKMRVIREAGRYMVVMKNNILPLVPRTAS